MHLIDGDFVSHQQVKSLRSGVEAHLGSCHASHRRQLRLPPCSQSLRSGMVGHRCKYVFTAADHLCLCHQCHQHSELQAAPLVQPWEVGLHRGPTQGRCSSSARQRHASQGDHGAEAFPGQLQLHLMEVLHYIAINWRAWQVLRFQAIEGAHSSSG